jgi:hypothetical protein
MGNIESQTVAMVSSVAKKVGDVIIQNVQQQQRHQQQKQQQQQQQQQPPNQQQEQPQQPLSVGENALVEEVTALETKQQNQTLSETDTARLLELQRRIERIKGLTEKGSLDRAEQEELHAWHNNTYDEWSSNHVVLELGVPPQPVAQVHFQEHIAVHAARAAPQMFARLRPLDEQESHIDPAVQEELGM